MRAVILIGCAVLAVAGCGSASRSEGPPAEVVQLKDVNELVRLFDEQKKKAPASAADLRLFESAYPTGYEAVRSGEVVVLWGVRPDGGSGLLAHVKNAPTEGGYVLLRNGETKRMTAEECKSAIQAK